MAWEPAVLAAAQLLEALCVPLGTVLESVKSPLNRKPLTIERGKVVEYQQQL